MDSRLKNLKRIKLENLKQLEDPATPPEDVSSLKRDIEHIEKQIEYFERTIPKDLTPEDQARMKHLNAVLDHRRADKSERCPVFEIHRVLYKNDEKQRYCYYIVEHQGYSQYAPDPNDSDDSGFIDSETVVQMVWCLYDEWYIEDDEDEEHYKFKKLTSNSENKIDEEDIISADEESYLNILYSLYKDKTAFDERENCWYYCEDGIWKKSESKTNYYLHRQMPEFRKHLKRLKFEREMEVASEVKKFEKELSKHKLRIVTVQTINEKGKQTEQTQIQKNVTEEVWLPIDINGEGEINKVPDEIKKKLNEAGMEKKDFYLAGIDAKIKQLGATVKFVSRLLSDNSLKAKFINPKLFSRINKDKDSFVFKNGFIDLKNYKNPYIDGDIIFFPLHARDCHFINTGYKLKKQNFLQEKGYLSEITTIYQQMTITPAEFEFLISSRAMCLSGRRKRNNIIIDYGLGGSQGKSILQEQLKYTFGKYYSEVPRETFTYKNKYKLQEYTGNEPEPHLVNLGGKRIVYCPEIGKDANFHEAKLKLWTGGDSISCRGLHQTNLTLIEPQCRFIFTTNNMTKYDITDDAFLDRVIIKEWKVQFLDKVKEETDTKKRRDNRLTSKIFDDDVKHHFASAFFFVLLSRFNPDYIVPDEFDKYKKEITEERNYAQMFFEENVVRHNETEKKVVGKKQILDAFDEWFGEQGFERSEKPSKDDFLFKLAENYKGGDDYCIRKGAKPVTIYGSTHRNYFKDTSVKTIV
jgi:hypothetical protein